jgi:ribose transport system ATP-binding protein
MLGYSLEDYYPEARDVDGDIIFSVKDVSGSYVKEFSLDVRRGEIIGLTGLLGMGQADVLYLLFGAAEASTGAIHIEGQTFQLNQFSPIRARQAGLALLPANRLRDGGVRLATAAENISLAIVKRFYTRGLLRKRLEAAKMKELMHVFEVNPPEPAQVFGTFSGGNQQKALIAKWLTTNPKTLLLHEPTQGVDVGARRQIFAQLRNAADEGIGTIIASTEYEDLAGLCDRVFVFRNGSVVAQLSGASLTLDRILEQCYRDERTTAQAAV